MKTLRQAIAEFRRKIGLDMPSPHLDRPWRFHNDYSARGTHQLGDKQFGAYVIGDVWVLPGEDTTIGVLWDKIEGQEFYKAFDLHHPDSIQKIKDCIEELRNR